MEGKGAGARSIGLNVGDMKTAKKHHKAMQRLPGLYAIPDGRFEVIEFLGLSLSSSYDAVHEWSFTGVLSLDG